MADKLIMYRDEYHFQVPTYIHDIQCAGPDCKICYIGKIENQYHISRYLRKFIDFANRNYYRYNKRDMLFTCSNYFSISGVILTKYCRYFGITVSSFQSMGEGKVSEKLRDRMIEVGGHHMMASAKKFNLEK